MRENGCFGGGFGARGVPTGGCDEGIQTDFIACAPRTAFLIESHSTAKTGQFLAELDLRDISTEIWLRFP